MNRYFIGGFMVFNLTGWIINYTGHVRFSVEHISRINLEPTCEVKGAPHKLGVKIYVSMQL